MIAKRGRWAFEELVIDKKMIEANDLCNGDVKGMYRYLLNELGSAQAVVSHLEAMLLHRRPLKSLVLDKNAHMLVKKIKR
jgi:hypothetical protein